jgi:hypothetical protein
MGTFRTVTEDTEDHRGPQRGLRRVRVTYHGEDPVFWGDLAGAQVPPTQGTEGRPPGKKPAFYLTG